YAVIDPAVFEPKEPEPEVPAGSKTQIHSKHLRAALAIWQYCEDSANQLFGGITGDPVADTIIASLKASPGGMTRTDMINLFARHESSERIATALTTLLKRGKVRREEVEMPGHRGRREERWYWAEEDSHVEDA